MDEKQAKELFDKYNPKSGLVRCPSGRAKMCKPLNLYAKAAVNLYGIILKEDFVELFNAQNEEQTTINEVYILLLPYILKHGAYGFYKEYIVHKNILSDIEHVEYLEDKQAGKPRYIPKKEDFLEYANGMYDNYPLWLSVFLALGDSFGYVENTSQGFEDLRAYVTASSDLCQLDAIMEKYNFVFSSKEQGQKFIDTLMLARKLTRTWDNKGHNLSELYSFLKKESLPPLIHNVKVGRNDPCPCGSGKKYKKCCSAIQAKGTAQLSSSERKLFYETWYKLLDFINNKYHIVDMYINPSYPSFHDELELYKIRVKLWEEPELISSFIKEAIWLSTEEQMLLQSWQTRFIKGEFIILGHTPKYSLLMTMDNDDDKPRKLYGVMGMTEAIAKAIHIELPTTIETVLLPFKDKIVYDSFMKLHGTTFNEAAKELFTEEYTKSRDTYGIITTL